MTDKKEPTAQELIESMLQEIEILAHRAYDLEREDTPASEDDLSDLDARMRIQEARLDRMEIQRAKKKRAQHETPAA